MRTENAMQMLLAAATELAEARRHDSETAEEWDALERAITFAEETAPPTYEFDGDMFIRRSRDRNGESDIDVCNIDDIEQVVIAITDDADPHGNGWFVVDELVAPSGRTWTRCLLAVECLKQLGMLTERALDNRITVADDFSVDAAIEAFKRTAGLSEA